MAYQIRKHKKTYGYYVYDTIKRKVINKNMDLDDANIMCWQNKDPATRYQILANSFSRRQELNWYTDGDIIIEPNGYASIEEARLEIVQDLQECCVNNDYERHPNPEGDYSIIDTFTGEEVDYSISEEEASHPDPSFIEQEY